MRDLDLLPEPLFVHRALFGRRAIGHLHDEVAFRSALVLDLEHFSEAAAITNRPDDPIVAPHDGSGAEDCR